MRGRRWKIDLGRPVACGLGSIIGLTLAGWPSNAAEAAWIGFVGLILGLLIALVGEYVARLREEARRLQNVKHDLEDERKQRAQERRLWERQIAVAQREHLLSEAAVEVWGGAYREAMSTGRFLPTEAILARLEVTQQARNIDKPLPPFDPNPPADGPHGPR